MYIFMPKEVDEEAFAQVSEGKYDWLNMRQTIVECGAVLDNTLVISLLRDARAVGYDFNPSYLRPIGYY
jgi:hypothetical protein